MHGLGQQRQRAADQLCNHDCAEHRERDDQRDVGAVIGQKRDSQEIDRRERHAEQHRHAQFLPQHLPEVFRLDLAQREAADRQRRGLRAAIAAGVHQHRDAGDQRHADARGVLQHRFKVRDDLAGKQRRNHQNHQPRQAVFRQRQHAGLQIRVVRRQHGRHLFEVLGVFLFDDVHDIVDRDDADHAVFMIDHRNGQQVVFAHCVGDELLVVRGAHGDYLRVHQLLDLAIVPGKQQLSQRDRAQQHAAIVENIQRIDRFLVRRVLANGLHRLADRRAHMEIHVFDGHDAAGAVFGIAQKLVDQRALVFIAIF